MNNQAVTVHWRIAADQPTKEGDYLTCFRMKDNSLGDQEVLRFEGVIWQELASGFFEEVFPDFWAEVPYPRD